MKKRKKTICCLKHLKAFLLPMLCYLSVMTIQAQSGTVIGTIQDENGGLFGASVVEKGTQNGTITDVNGRFTIAVKNVKNSILKCSFVGYETIEVPLNGRKTIDITMTSAVKTLNEVVAIGYGNVKKRDLTGSVSSVRSEELLKVNP